ncbi:hypothetical protein ES332_D09G067200v1 [Gossypium tomentosum]|uniref:Uncharacterized protein n=1 Tax=Gossypium tomentosum TaxID=34277 RepID=A0A5D2JEX8_GOSTO|nr:hypothetical protein ES332_D09G067200v1 [Gossypium tomentosum]TYH52994.1 hypothetical protein ES332_D09G067200v1 [Gossypium tomentosum]
MQNLNRISMAATAYSKGELEYAAYLSDQVTKLLEKEGIQWREENRGTILIKLDGYREFSFLESNSDTE